MAVISRCPAALFWSSCTISPTVVTIPATLNQVLLWNAAELLIATLNSCKCLCYCKVTFFLRQFHCLVFSLNWKFLMKISSTVTVQLGDFLSGCSNTSIDLWWWALVSDVAPSLFSDLCGELSSKHACYYLCSLSEHLERRRTSSEGDSTFFSVQFTFRWSVNIHYIRIGYKHSLCKGNK